MGYTPMDHWRCLGFIVPSIVPLCHHYAMHCAMGFVYRDELEKMGGIVHQNAVVLVHPDDAIF
jgi:hypothetical protein